jgi:hypothetical protein
MHGAQEISLRGHHLLGNPSRVSFGTSTSVQTIGSPVPPVQEPMPTTAPRVRGGGPAGVRRSTASGACSAVLFTNGTRATSCGEVQPPRRLLVPPSGERKPVRAAGSRTSRYEHQGADEPSRTTRRRRTASAGSDCGVMTRPRAVVHAFAMAARTRAGSGRA